MFVFGLDRLVPEDQPVLFLEVLQEGEGVSVTVLDVHPQRETREGGEGPVDLSDEGPVAVEPSKGVNPAVGVRLALVHTEETVGLGAVSEGGLSHGQMGHETELKDPLVGLLASDPEEKLGCEGLVRERGVGEEKPCEGVIEEVELPAVSGFAVAVLLGVTGPGEGRDTFGQPLNLQLPDPGEAALQGEEGLGAAGREKVGVQGVGRPPSVPLEASLFTALEETVAVAVVPAPLLPRSASALQEARLLVPQLVGGVLRRGQETPSGGEVEEESQRGAGPEAVPPVLGP